MKEPLKILYIRTDRIGDALMNLPALRRIRQNHPKAWITLAASAQTAELFFGHPDLDEVTSLDACAISRKMPGSIWNLAKKWKKIGYGAAVVSNPQKWAHAAVFFAGIPLRAGYDRKWGFFLNRKIEDRKDREELHEIDFNLQLAGLLGEKLWDGTIDLPLDREAFGRIQSRLAAEALINDNVVCVHPGTSDPLKRWTENGFARVCDWAVKRYEARILFVGGAEERAVSQRVAAQMESPAVDWTGQTDLRELYALFKCPGVKTLLSCDSGPLHLAWIAGKPVVGLYAKNAPGCRPARWGPRSQGSQVIHRPMEAVAPEEVCEALKRVLEFQASLS